MMLDPYKLSIEKGGFERVRCDCCSSDTVSISGYIYDEEVALAVYWVRWTASHLQEEGAQLDLVLGRWGEGTSASDRFAVAIQHRQMEDGTPSLMVVDATGRPTADGMLATTALRREDVIGTSLAPQVFALTDAIYLHDDRLFTGD